MAIRKRGENWVVDYYVNGKRKTETIGPDKKEAQIYEGKIKAEIREGKFFDVRQSNKITVSQLMTRFLTQDNGNGGKRSSSTLNFYQLCSRHLDKFMGNVLLKDLKPSLLREYIERRGSQKVSNSTINRELAFLKVCFSYAVKLELINENPVKKIDMLKEPKGRTRYLSVLEKDQLMEALPWHIQPIVLFAMYTGMRKEEILSLKWNQVSFPLRTVTLPVTKNGETRCVPLNDTAIAVLKDIGKVRRLDIEYVFFNPLTDQRWIDVSHTFQKACKKARIVDFRFHDLRHTAATYMVQNGVDLHVLKEILGHKTLDMTLRYAHLSQKNKLDAIRVLDSAFEEKEVEVVTNWLQVEGKRESINFSSRLSGRYDSEKMAGATGLEPATTSFGGSFSEKYLELLSGTEEYSKMRKILLGKASKKVTKLSTE